MKILSIVISLGLMVYLGQQAVALHKLTVCRQEAWRSAVTLRTRTLLSKSSPSEKDFLPKCRIIVTRNNEKVSWVRLTSTSRHSVPLTLVGKL